MIIIGFSGPANSGKDTAAQYLSSIEPRAFSMAFADPLKRAVIEMFSLDYDAFSDREIKERPIPALEKSPRQLAQIIGTDIVRAIHPDAWLIAMDRRLTGLHLALLLTDLRFENEAAWVRGNGGAVIHIIRPIARWQPDGHESERGIECKTGDFTIINSGTLEEFHGKILSVYTALTSVRETMK